jgi:hypothetical protein
MATCDTESHQASKYFDRLSWRRQRADYEVLRLVARYVYSVKLCDVQRVRREGQEFYRKQRLPRSTLLVASSNWWLRHNGGTLYGLSETEWLDWECRLAPEAQGRPVKVQGNVLWTPGFSGVSLRTWLSSRIEPVAKQHAFMAAIRELRRLHSLDTSFPDGTTRLWSHGDSHAGNVFFDAVHHGVTWFDFEAIHAAHLSASWRHADDVRALIFSSAAYLPLQRVEDLALWAVAALNKPTDRAVLQELSLMVRQMQKRPTLFQLAQAPLDFLRHQRLVAALQSTLQQTLSFGICGKR